MAEEAKRERIPYSLPYGSARRLLDVIKSKDISILQMSRATTVSRSQIYRYLYEYSDMRASSLAKICRYCGVSMDYITGISVCDSATKAEVTQTIDKTIRELTALKSTLT